MPVKRVACVALLNLTAGVRAQLPPAALGVPLIDLDAEAARQVIIDREPGRYLGHPSTVSLEDGRTMFVVYPGGHGRGPILLQRSDDGGRTWSGRLPTPENWATSLETPTIHRLVDPRDGRPRLIVFSGLHPARRAWSDDDGRTWSPLEPVGEWGGIVVMSSVGPIGTAPGGLYGAFFHDDGRFLRSGGTADGIFRLLQSNSDDGGMTWSPPREIWAGGDLHLCEPGAIRSPDGGTLALLLRENRRRAPSHVMVSSDGTSTWGDPRPLAPALTGDRHVARYAPGADPPAAARIVVTFRDMAADSPTRGDWMVWVGTWNDVVQARPGEFRARLKDNHHAWDCGYAGLEVLPDGTFVAVSYGHWTANEEPYVIGVRFALAELDDRARRADPPP